MTEDKNIIHLFIESGPDQDRRITVPGEGGRIGRSSSNDMVLSDPSLSRFHCRVFFKPDGRLWVSDLKSTNETLVNKKPVQDLALNVGDRIEIGETILRVECNTLTGVASVREPSPSPPPPPPAPSGGAEAPAEEAAPVDIDLGFKEGKPAASSGQSKGGGRPVRWMPVVVVTLVLAILVALIYALRYVGDKGGDTAAKGGDRAPPKLQLTYEKVEAGADNIFRYYLEFDGSELSATVDDLANGRHASNTMVVDPELVKEFTRTISDSEFMSLQEEYTGLARDIHEAKDLAVTLGRKHHRVVVLNRLEPEAFKEIRLALEEFAQNELGLAALALPPEKLLELAWEAFLQAQKLYAEREVRYGNLFQAIKSFQEAEWYLETIEPKPDYYGDIVSAVEQARSDLQDRYDDLLFRSERATKLRDWDTAARHLRVISEMIPDRFDERHQKAQRKLLDVERRISN